MEIRVLQYFLEVAERENITKAAEALHITQPALSRQLAELEKELDTQLFLRGKRKTTLTEEGKLLQKRAQEITSLVHKTKEEMGHRVDTISGQVRIGCAETEGMRFLLRIQKEILTQYLHITCQLYDGHNADVLEKLDKGLLDFGVLSALSHLRRYDYIRLPHQDTWGVLLPKNAPLAKEKTISPKDLWHVPLILSQQAIDNGDIAHYLQKDINDLYITGTYNLLFNASLMVEEGIGYALAYDHIIATGPDSPLIFRPLSPKHTVSTYFIWKRHQLFSPAANLLKQKIEKAVSVTTSH